MITIQAVICGLKIHKKTLVPIQMLTSVTILPEKSPCQLSDVFSHVSPLEPVRQGSLSPTPCIDS